jgi:phosphatidylglycerol:prolipoprotein diacylglycerol transferase
MFYYPQINPVAFSLGPLHVHWYGLMYLLSFLFGWLLALYRAKKLNLDFSSDQITDLLFYVAIGVVVGGRVGYILFYDFTTFIHHPLFLFEVWDGGMSFHGGMIGVCLMCAWWCYKQKKNIFDVGDFICPIIPIGLAAGRFGNFINGELCGRITNMPWGVIYPNVDQFPRHPSVLYELFLEGILLFIILWCYASKRRPRMAVTGLFFLLYGCFRIFCEFFRQPDQQLGFIAFDWLTRGIELSLPMVLFGVVLLFLAYRRRAVI